MNEVGKKVGEIFVALKLNKQEFQQSVMKIPADVNEASRKITASMNKVPAEVNNAGNKISASLGKIGKMCAAAFSVAAVTSFVKTVTKSAAEVQAANSQFEQTFGSLADSASEAMEKVAEESGIVKTRLQGVGTSIFAFAKTTGMDSASALNMMQEALQVTADSAAYYDRSLEDVSESLMSFLKGNYANDAALGLSCTETTRNTAANKLYGKSFKDLSEAQKQLTLLQMVKDANAASGALGQAARESDGLENVLGNLKETWKQFLAIVGKPVLKVAVVVIQNITTALQKMMEVARAAVGSLGELFGWDMNDSAQGTKVAQTATEAISAAINESVNNQEELTKATKKTNDEVKRGVASFDKLNIISSTKADEAEDDSGTSSLSLNDNSFPRDYTISSKLDMDTNDANSKLDELKEKFRKLFDPLIEAYKKYIEPIVTKVKKFIDDLSLAFSLWRQNLNLEPLKESIEHILEKLEPLVDVILPQISYIIQEVILPVLKLVAEHVLPAILNCIAHIIGFITPILEGIGKVLKPIWENILLPALQKIAEWIDKIVQEVGPKLEILGKKIGNLFEKLEPIVDLLTKILGPVISAILDVIGGAVMTQLSLLIDTIGDIIDIFSGMLDILNGVISFVTGVFSGNWKKAWQGIEDCVKGVWQGIWSIIRGVGNLIIDGINTLWTGIYSAVVGIVNSLGGIAGAVGDLFGQDWHFSMPAEPPLIPRLAHGGLATAPTLALVGDNAGASTGDPEVIAPLSKLNGMIGQAGGYDTTLLTQILDYMKKIYEMFILMRREGGATYRFIAELEGNVLFDEFVDRVRLYKMRYGTLPF